MSISIADRLKMLGVEEAKLCAPIWDGPTSDSNIGGITFSLLSKYLVCKERFRLLTIEGLKSRDRFNHRLEYGNLWHLAEQFIDENWQDKLKDYAQELATKYPFSQEDIDKWYNVCRIQFPEYVKHWQKREDILPRTPILQEQEFRVPYLLPSGRVVYLRGKWDRVDLVTALDGDTLWLQENKTKGEIEQERIYKQLTYDLQTMLYIIALQYRGDKIISELLDTDIGGVIYNVVRRPLSGGIGTIIQKDGESKQSYYDRLRGYIDGTGLDGKKRPTPGPDFYFMRWKCDVSFTDIASFQQTCFNSLLENVCDDYEWWADCKKNGDSVYHTKIRREAFPHHIPRHYRMPFGIYNPLTEDGGTEYDDYLATGNDAALQKTDNLFPELKGA